MFVYLSFNFDFYVSKIIHLYINTFMSYESSTQTKQLSEVSEEPWQN